MDKVPKIYVAWYCRECRYEHESDKPSYSHPVKCPKCNKKSISAGYPRLPINQVTRDKKPKQYYILGGEKEIQVYLRAVSGERAGVSFPPHKVPDCDGDPIEVAKEVLEMCERFIYYSGLGKMRKVVKAMIKGEKQSAKNENINRLYELRKTIVCGIYEYNLLMEEA